MALTPNSLATTGQRIPEQVIETMTTEQLLKYFCEIKQFMSVYEAEVDAIKKAALARTDLPQKYSHPDHGFGDIVQKSAGGKTVINVVSVSKTIGIDLTLQAASISMESLKKVTTTAQREAMAKDNTIVSIPGSTTIEYKKFTG